MADLDASMAIIGAAVAALITVAAAITAAVNALRASRKADRLEDGQRAAAKGQEEIHVLVNSRLTEALDKIASLEARIAGMTGKPSDVSAANRSAIEAKHKEEPK